MHYIQRTIESTIAHALARGKSVLLLGPRQTGKTTLLDRLGGALSLSLVRPDVRQRYERDPALLAAEVEELMAKKNAPIPLVLLDEVQKVPALLDVVQDLIDRRRARFVLTGSSARALRHGVHVNLLPGRLVTLHCDPLTYQEYPPMSLQQRLLFGTLPGILRAGSSDAREEDLRSYVTTYLEEEVRAEAMVRNLGNFGRFLELAASESGNLVSFRRLSQDIGVAHTTIQSYYQILEDCLITERVEPLVQSSTRRKLSRAQKLVFFDLGVRRRAADEGTRLPREKWGQLFEQHVGLELIRLARRARGDVSVHYWRDPDGPEVDWVLKQGERLAPIEVKWTEAPTLREAKHLKIFLREYACPRGFIVCRTPRRLRLSPTITALPWQELAEVFA